jgi:putative membrane protein
VTPPFEEQPVETQPERTALAWQRTGLGVIAVAGIVAHGAVKHENPLLLAVAGAAALLGLGVLGGLAPVRYRQVRCRRAADAAMSAPGLITAVTVAVALVALAAATAVLTLR